MSKLNIKEEMRSIDTKDRGWYDSLTEEEKKKLGIWLLMRYTSSAGSKMFAEHYLEWTNEVVNVHFNKLRQNVKKLKCSSGFNTLKAAGGKLKNANIL